MIARNLWIVSENGIQSLQLSYPATGHFGFFICRDITVSGAGWKLHRDGGLPGSASEQGKDKGMWCQSERKDKGVYSDSERLRAASSGYSILT